MPLRVRHHTDDAGLAGIQRTGGIRASRGWARIDAGVHVEVEPFGSAVPAEQPRSSPLNDFRCNGEGAFVEFDAPPELIEYSCGPRRSGVIPIAAGAMLLLENLNPQFVKVRYHWWQWWRTKVR